MVNPPSNIYMWISVQGTEDIPPEEPPPPPEERPPPVSPALVELVNLVSSIVVIALVISVIYSLIGRED